MAKTSALSVDVPESAKGVSPLTEFAGYRIQNSLGHTPVAAVYRCRKMGEANAGERYAMSIVHDDLEPHRWLIDQLLADVTACARLNHPNVESVVESAIRAEHTFVVVRHVEGCPLWQLPALPPPRVVIPIVVDVLRGLHAAHSLRDERGHATPLVHGGISPASIVVGFDGVTRVTEFGLAKAQMQTTQTMRGVRTDRFAYLSPEQIGRSTGLDFRVDLFAVASILWSMLTGQSLFRGTDAVSTMHNVLHAPIPAPSTIGCQPPAWVDPIVLRALEREPERRPESAEQMAALLQELATKQKCWASRSEVAHWVKSALAAAAKLSKTMEGRVFPSAAFPSGGALPQASSKAEQVDAPVVRARGPRRVLVSVAIMLMTGLAFGLRARSTSPFDSTRPATTTHIPLLAPPPPQLAPASAALADPAPIDHPLATSSAESPSARPSIVQVASSAPPAASAATERVPAPIRSAPPRAAEPTPTASAPLLEEEERNLETESPPAPLPTAAPLPTIESNPYLRKMH
jgi:serine/threonine-protein kinase